MSELSKVYAPDEVEGRIYKSWEEGGYFTASPDPSKKPFCIAIPPPNVTGVLHLGHALDNTLQDILIRTKRMQGYAALWIPGTDHAGIATQNVVEKELRSQGRTRHDLGRAKFVELVWEWKQKYGGQIIEQLKRLGSSADWSRERFTMDPGLSKAVRKVFVDLFNEDLIYRGNRIINWCPGCETAISDVEVNHIDHKGELVRFKYPLADRSGHVTVATTRLETMLGDTAIAVHPEDDRYRDLIGRMARHPIHGREIPIVADEAVESEFGTGAVKITPAHDQTDFEIAERHNLDKINIFDVKAFVNENGGPFAGLNRYEAREAVREELAKQSLLTGSDEHEYQIGVCDRCKTVIEPWLSEQWFVRMRPLAEPAIEAVKQGRTRFYPERWTNYYLNWMEQVRDWCISRQLWWGHRIPVWYCDDCEKVWASMDDPSVCSECDSSSIRQDPDVLDTWFSSQLWPFSVLGWPEQTEDLAYFYPTVATVPGYEIIHLWVSRMMIAGLHFMGDVPFKWAIIHGIVRDEKGQKMSKSLGNGIDPIGLIDRYGTDALRFTLAEHATGQDIFLNEEWIAGSRNFANKLWNASRFVLMNAEFAADELPENLEISDRWILSLLANVTKDVTDRLERFEIAAAARTLYEFIWNEYCDWYIESSKSRLYGDDDKAKADVATVLVWVLESTLRLLHPIMPFITEEIWMTLPGTKSSSALIVAQWPESDAAAIDLEAEASFDRIKEVVGAIRRFRSDHRVALATNVEVFLSSANAEALANLRREESMLAGLARHTTFMFSSEPPTEEAVARLSVGDIDIAIPLAGLLDLDAERERLNKGLGQARAEIERLSTKLSNEGFRAKAPADVVAQQEQKLKEQSELEAMVLDQLDQLDTPSK
ncbi:MAG: valine--tRNA ligase [Actinomycetota bacterium]